MAENKKGGVGIRLSDQIARWMQVGEKLFGATKAEIQERAMSYHRLVEKIWALISWDSWLVDVLYEGGNFTAIIYDQNANLYAMPVLFEGDDVYLGEGTRISESYEIVPQTGGEADTVRSMRGRIRVFRGEDGGKYWIMRACTAVMNRVGEIDSSALFDCFISRFNSGEYPTPYLTLQHMGEEYKMGETVALFREGVVLLSVGRFDDGNGLADAAFESLERDVDEQYWGVSIGYGLDENDPPPEIMTARFRTADGEVAIPIPVFNQGFMIENSLLAENEAASFFTSVSPVRAEVRNAMPLKRKTRGLKDNLLKLFPQQTALVDEVVAGTKSVNDLVQARQLIHRSGTDASATATDAATQTQQAVDFKNIELDDDALDALAERLGNDESFLARLAKQFEVAGGEPDQAESLVVEEMRGMLGDLIADYDEMAGVINDLLAEREQDDDRQSRSTRISYKGASNRPSMRDRSRDDDEPRQRRQPAQQMGGAKSTQLRSKNKDAMAEIDEMLTDIADDL